MKKSTLVVLIGGFIVLSAFLGPLSQEKMYKKQKNFNSPEEVIAMLDGKPLFGWENGSRHRIKETEVLSECLSVRSRVTERDISISKFDVKEIIELDEKTENDLLNYYNNLREKFTKRLPISSEKAVRLKVDTYHMDYRTGEMELSEGEDFYPILDFVLVNEGEGYVIDYIYRSDSNSLPDYSRVNEHGDLYRPGIDDKSYSIDEYKRMSEDRINKEQEVGDNA